MDIPILSNIFDPLKGSRQAENEDTSREAATAGQLKTIGNDELGRYQNPTTTAAQDKELAGYSGSMAKTTGDFYKEAGMKGSSQELASMKQWSDTVKGIKFDMLETTKHESWVRALTSLGLSQESSRQIALMHTQDREEKIQLYSGLMNAVGSVVRMGAL